MKKILLLAAMAIFAVACYWEDEETLYPEPEICDTLDVSFAEDVAPILSNNCYMCHSNANAPDFTFGFSLEDYEDVAAASSLIVDAINHKEGITAMPKNGDKLDTCTINTIEAWVNQGSHNN
jgi:cytochrome c5